MLSNLALPALTDFRAKGWFEKARLPPRAAMKRGLQLPAQDCLLAVSWPLLRRALRGRLTTACCPNSCVWQWLERKDSRLGRALKTAWRGRSALKAC
jgi:hypothetical protein